MPIQTTTTDSNNNNVENSIIDKESSSLLSTTMSNVTIYDDAAVVNETTSTTTIEELVKDNNSTIIKPKKRIIIRRKQSQKQSQQQGSGDQQNDTSKIINIELYNELIKSLPIAYDFELLKTIKRCNELYTKNIALQMPEGLLMYSCIISDILIQLVSTLISITILSDVTYGACCIDDINATLLNCDLLVHYGHSCLIPIQHTTTNNNQNSISILYVFVEIQINEQHVVDCFIVSINDYIKKKGITKSQNNDNNNDIYYIYLLGTIQFRHALITIQQKLQTNGYKNVIIPQSKPLSPGEVLGCTSPKLIVPTSDDHRVIHSVCYFIADGRFHMESTMIGNPKIDLYYRYNPYTRTITIEQYDHLCMNEIRGNAIQKAIHSIHHVPNCTIGIIMGTLGRQGNPAIVQRIKDLINQYNQDNNKNKDIATNGGTTSTSTTTNTIRHFTMLLSEISPYKLNLFQKKVQIWIQIACPRLSIDWGHYLTNNNTIPVLNPYEFYCCFNSDLLWYNNNNNDDDDDEKKSNNSSRQIQSYPMDYYSSHGGPWSNYHANNKSRTMTTRNENQVSSEKVIHHNNINVVEAKEVDSPSGCNNCSCKESSS